MNDGGAKTWKVERGAIHVYRLFDVADAIDLAAAEALITAPKSRLKLEGHGSGAVEIPRPPVTVGLGQRTLPIAGVDRVAEASARFFDFGVASVLYRVPIAPGTTLLSLLPVAEELLGEPTRAIDAAARREVDELARTLAPSLEKPHAWEGLETYTVVFVEALEGRPAAKDVLADAPIARLLLGETSVIALSDSEKQDLLRHAWSYLADDVAVIDWNSAFVLEPSGVRDIPDLLEFATAHLLELRYYDALLDRELHQIYDALEENDRTSIWSNKTRLVQRRTAGLLLELSEMIERLENAVKVVGDFYLARLYQGALKRFRLPAWQDSVLRKQRLLADVNAQMNHEVETRRSQILELAVILLILGELVLALRVGR
jgi:hypothetical protein